MTTLDHCEVRITCGSHDEAATIADALVKAKLVACAHLVQISSVYEWRDVVEHDDEVLLISLANQLAMGLRNQRLLEETGYEASEWTSLGSYRVGANRGVAMAHFYLARSASQAEQGRKQAVEKGQKLDADLTGTVVSRFARF